MALMPRDKLNTMLTTFAQQGKAVSKEDIEGFFNTLRSGGS